MSTADVQETNCDARANLESRVKAAKFIPGRIDEKGKELMRGAEETMALINEGFGRIIEQAERRRDELLGKLMKMRDEKVGELMSIRVEAINALNAATALLKESAKTGENPCEMTKATKRIEKAGKMFSGVENVRFIPRLDAVATFDKPFVESIRKLGNVRMDEEVDESPCNFHVASKNVHSVGLSWDKMENAKSYIVSMKESKSGKYATVYQGQDNHCEILYIKAGISYDFQVKGVYGNVMSKPTELKGVIAAEKMNVAETVKEFKDYVINNKDCSVLLEELSDLTKYDEENRAMAGRSGTIEVIVEVLKTHEDDANICAKCCDTLMNVTINNGKNKIKNNCHLYQKYAYFLLK